MIGLKVIYLTGKCMYNPQLEKVRNFAIQNIEMYHTVFPKEVAWDPCCF